MSPIECAMDVAAFIKTVALKDYVPLNGHEIKCYAGFLPKTVSKLEKEGQCYNIVVRPTIIKDEDSSNLRVSTVELQILVQLFDNDKDKSCLELYHLLEIVRQSLLSNPVINGQYRRNGGIETRIPEEQPFPRWWGYMIVTFDIHQMHFSQVQDYFYEEGER